SGPLVPEAAQLLLRQLEQRTTARLRILDGDGQTLADSARLGPREPASLPAPPPRPWWQNALAFVLRPVRRLLDAPPRLAAPPDAPEPMPTTEVRAALAGRYGAATRVDAARRTVVLASAVPVE